MNPDEIIELLGLEPLPGEGGMWAQTWLDDRGSGIYFLLRPGGSSKLHRLHAPELWHHYVGAPVQMLLLSDDGRIERPVLGPDLAGGQRPCVVVRPGTWMGAATSGEYSLIGTTMAPPFDDARFELADRATLLAAFPDAAAEITALT